MATTTSFGTSSTTTAGLDQPSKDTRNNARHRTKWIIIGTTLGVSILVTYTTLLLCTVIAVSSVKRCRDRKSHPNLLEYDNVPSGDRREDKEDDEDSEHPDVDELTELIPGQPPPYKNLEKMDEKLELDPSPL